MCSPRPESLGLEDIVAELSPLRLSEQGKDGTSRSGLSEPSIWGGLGGHANEDKPKEEAAGKEKSENTYEKDKKDTGGDYVKLEKQEVEGNAYKTKGDADQACEGDA
ncbi:hypothetical protein NDU88_003202 [Pleurodeles waltl]|uniref:Uncharacterized protein n=1 Tax=Pleurodeles waltl TaxID=8319 RepID=A0AAV7RGQ7_PLEWA|nr:hypothetical protein NDU88_003202 [Pleurodeles waltl]